MSIDLLVRFTRLAAAAPSPEAILPLLAQIAVTELGCAASAVLRVDEAGRLVVSAQEGLPPAAEAWRGEPEDIAGEAAEALLAATGGAFERVTTLPLVSGHDLYGAFLCFHGAGAEPPAERRALLDALCDVAATALDKASQLESLRRSYDELRASREILARGEKLRALGQVAAGISHDLKNLLNPLSLQVQLAERRLHKDPAQVAPVLETMRSTLAHGLAVVERLRDFSRQAPERGLGPVDLDEVAREAIELARPRWRPLEGRVALDCEPGRPPKVTVSASELVSAVVNLVVNACDALAAAGTGTRIVVATGAADGGAFVEVYDDGPGMTREVQDRLFEPFFTTKGSEGTGLGLPMVYALVQRHGGRIDVKSAPGEGARLRLWFPAAG